MGNDYSGSTKLEGNNCYLRAFKPGDWFDVQELMDKRFFHENEDPMFEVNSLDDAIELTLYFINTRESRFHHYWAVVDKTSDKVIGLIYSNDCYRNRTVINIGYVINHEFRKKGYCKEALNLAVSHFAKIDKCKRVEAYIEVNNLPSVTLMKSIDLFKYEGTFHALVNDSRGQHDIYVYAAVL